MADGSTASKRGGDDKVGAQTPVELIRQRETVLSGRVLAAKREADELIIDARRQAVAIIETTTEESAETARERARVLADEAEVDVAEMRSAAEAEAKALSDSITSRIPTAVDYIVQSVVGK